MSNFVDDVFVGTITRLLSSERLATFRRLSGSPMGAILLHQQAGQLAGALMTVTATIEIALRNATCHWLGLYFSTDDWLRSPPSYFKWEIGEKSKITAAESSAKKAAYAKLGSCGRRAIDRRIFPNGIPENKSLDDLTKARRSYLSVPDGQVIAQLTLFFWKRLYSADYETTLWDKTLKKVFPNKSVTRSRVAFHLESVYQARNRIAHHEPMYGKRLDDAVVAIDFLSSEIGPLIEGMVPPLQQLQRVDRAALGQQVDALHQRLDGLTSNR